jgi:Tol biopolymer transport system component
LYVQSLQNGELRRLTADSQFIEGLCWTPDGKEVVFASSRGGFRNLWRIAADAEAGRTAARVVTSSPGNTLHPAVGPGSGPGQYKLAYVWIKDDVSIRRTGKEWPADPASIEDVVKGEGSRVNPSVSPRGDVIAYVSYESGFSEIWTTKVVGGSPRQITRLARPPTMEPSWTADGEHLFFSSAGDLWTVRREGQDLRQITRNPWTEERPRMAYDGSLYYISFEGGSPGVWRSNFDVETKESLIVKGPVYDFALDAQGENIYFTRYRDQPVGLWRAPLTGGEAELIQPGVRGGCWTLEGGAVFFLDFRDGAISRHLPRDVMSLELTELKLQKVGAIPVTRDRNLHLGFDYDPATGQFYWSERITRVEDIWIDDFK